MRDVDLLRALSLALHAHLFEEAAAHGVLYATYSLGALGAAVALFVSLTLSPADGHWLGVEAKGP